LDKITGRIINFDEDVGETVQFGALRVKTDACYTRPATEAANTDAFVEVDEITLQGEVKRIFSGWMYAASPGLHGVEHPIYDIWLTDCKAPDATVVTAQPDPPKPAPAPAAQKRPPAPKQQAQRPPPPPQFQQQPYPQQPPPQPQPQQQPGGLFGIFRQ
jgi:outer membrane biosynthesis protein TonB